MASNPTGVDQETWNALLQWSMRNAVAQGGETGDGTKPSQFKAMSEEDKAWLTKVMSEGVVDQVKRARELIDKVKADILDPARAGKAPTGNPDDLLGAFEELQDITEQIDFAQNIVQIGGIPPLLEVITAGEGLIPDTLKSASLAVLATVAQNNPFAQNALLNLRVLPVFIHIVIATKSDSTSPRFSPQLRLKALHGISCLSRGYAPTEAAFYSGTAAFLASAPTPTEEDAEAAARAESARKVAALKASGGRSAASSSTAPPASAAATPPPLAGSPSSPVSRMSFFDPQGWFVADGFGLGDPSFDLGDAFSLDGPSLIARVLNPPSDAAAASSDAKLRRKAAFLLHALCSADDLKEEWAMAYAKACTAPLVQALEPTPSVPAGTAAAASHGGEQPSLDVDLRENALRALTTLAKKSPSCAALVFADGRQERLSEAQSLALRRAVTLGRSGSDTDGLANAKAEMALWKALFAAAPRSD